MLKINEKVSIFRFMTHEPGGDLSIALDHTTTGEEVEAFRKEMNRYPTSETNSVDLLIGGDIPQSKWQIVDADQLGNLSNAPVLIYSKSGDDVWINDETGFHEVSIFAAMWYYEPYQIRSWVEEVLSGRPVMFKRLKNPIVPIPDTIKAAVTKLDHIKELEQRIEDLRQGILELTRILLDHRAGSVSEEDALYQFLNKQKS